MVIEYVVITMHYVYLFGGIAKFWTGVPMVNYNLLQRCVNKCALLS